ncbi:MAG: PCP reductase family protein [Nitrospinae bacterium]|nr:PCP reductase family protein [Nitrospinota bacterium]
MTDTPSWSDDAKKVLEKIPFFARPIAKKMIEEYAVDKGQAQITPELMREARAKFGM